MIQVEYIIDKNKSLLTVSFNRKVLGHLKVKCDDYLNFYQSKYDLNRLTIFKADTGYRIKRVPNRKKTYCIQLSQQMEGFIEFSAVECTYYLKRNGFIQIRLSI